MNSVSLAILKFRKPILGFFVAFSFLQTSYAEKKFEETISFILRKKLSNSYLSGLKAISISRWHVDEMLINHPFLGTYEASDVFLEFKLLPLLFGKIHLSHLSLQTLNIKQDQEISFDPKIFNLIYKNSSILVDKLSIQQMNIPYIQKPICVSFYKRPYLNFCEIYDLERKHRAYFEIPRQGSFLKFKTDIALLTFDKIDTKLSGEGYIDKHAHIDLSGLLNYLSSSITIPVDVHLDFENTLQASGFVTGDLCHGFFHIKPEKIQANLSLAELEPLFPDLKLKGHLNVDMSGTWEALTTHVVSNRLFFDHKALGPIDIMLLKQKDSVLKCKGEILKGLAEELKAEACVSKHDQQLELDIALKGHYLSFDASCLIDSHNYPTFGFSLKSQNSKLLDGFFNGLKVEGDCHLVVNGSSGFSNIEFFGGFNNFKVGPYKLDKGHLAFKQSGDVGELKIDLDHFYSPYYEPISVNIEGKKQLSWDVLAKAKSSSFDFVSTSDVLITDQKIDLNISDIFGKWHDEPIKLWQAPSCSFDDSSLKINPFKIQLGPSYIEGFCHKTQDLFQLKGSVEHFNLKGFKAPHFESPLTGQLSLFTDIDSNKADSSLFQFSIKNLGLKQKGNYLCPLFIRGTQRFINQEMSYDLSGLFSNDDYLIFQGKIPFDLKHLKIKNQNAAYHSIFGKINVSDLGKYINLGTNTLGGQLLIDLNVSSINSRSFASGIIEGKHLHAGFPLLGIYLDSGEASFRPCGEKAEFMMKFSDFQKGYASCAGILNLDDYSYFAKTKFDDLFLKFKDLFWTQVSGELDAQGSFKSIHSQGHLSLSHPQYQLIHRDLKKTKTYVIERQGVDLPKPWKLAFGYDLNFNLSTKDALKIKGAGLDSDWNGHAKCHISDKKFSLDGDLNLAKGEYRFQTKKFVIDEGAIHLSESSPSSITAKGHLDIPTHQIKVGLFGPLHEPKIQFSSLPALSEGAIFSYILFNKPINQLHPFQSIELAQTLLELSSDQNPFSLSKIRANLSIDQLDIRTSDQDDTSLTLHLGKYLRPGLLVGLSQSKKASDMLIQLELKHGFLIKAESQDQKEGKFSLKWNKSF